MPVVPALSTSCGIWLPSSPLPESPCDAAPGNGVVAVFAPGSTTLPLASSAAAFRHESSARPPTPSVRSPASAQSARPPLRRTFPALAAALAVETSCRGRDSSFAPRCDASAPQLLPPDTASTAAWPAGSSPAAVHWHPRPAVACCALQPALPLVPTPSCSSAFAPI